MKCPPFILLRKQNQLSQTCAATAPAPAVSGEERGLWREGGAEEGEPGPRLKAQGKLGGSGLPANNLPLLR